MRKESCEGCYYYQDKPEVLSFKRPYCWRTKESLSGFSYCGTGRLLPFPTTGEELRRIVVLFEKKMRGEGERST